MPLKMKWESVYESHLFKLHVFVEQIRVSSEISNAPFILNVDCDMYANDADTVREILCFFMDEKTGHEVAYVQFPQNYDNLTKNDIYSNAAFSTSGVSSKYFFQNWDLIKLCFQN